MWFLAASGAGNTGGGFFLFIGSISVTAGSLENAGFSGSVTDVTDSFFILKINNK